MKRRLTIREMLFYAVCYSIIIFLFLKNILFIYALNNYKYAKEWNFDAKFVKSDLLYDDSIYQTEELNNLLIDCKESILSYNLEEIFPNLAWDKFDTVSIWFNPNYLQQSEEYYILGEYSHKFNYIIIAPEGLQKNNSEKHRIIIHELMHTLMYNVNLGQLEEGIAEFFAQIISGENGLDASISYKEELNFWLLLCNIWGIEDCMNMVINDTLNANIDKLTLPGFGRKFNIILYFIHYPDAYETGFKKEELIMMAQDIICHATKNYCKSVKDPLEREKILSLCRDILIIPNEYFLEILE